MRTMPRISVSLCLQQRWRGEPRRTEFRFMDVDTRSSGFSPGTCSEIYPYIFVVCEHPYTMTRERVCRMAGVLHPACRPAACRV